MLVLGGAGRLYGGLIGAIIFMIARDQFSGIAPQYWYFWIGVLLVCGHGSCPTASSAVCQIFTHDGNRTSDIRKSVLSHAHALGQKFWFAGRSRATSNNCRQGARYALIGPNGAEDNLINLMTGMLAPNAGQIFLGGEDITRSGHRNGYGAGSHARSRSIRCFRDSTRWKRSRSRWPNAAGSPVILA